MAISLRRGPLDVRTWVVAIVICGLLVVVLVNQRAWQGKIHLSSISSVFTDDAAHSPNLQDGHLTSDLFRQQSEFWRSFYQDLDLHKPRVSPIVHPEGVDLSIGYKSDVSPPRPDYLSMSVDQWKGLQKSHSEFTTAIRNRNYRLPYIPETYGIVTTAGPTYLPVLLVSIRMLRLTGSTLPVEVFLADSKEYDSKICDDILPTLNAKCLVLQDIFSYTHGTASPLEKYQYKVMALLFSSFEHVLFLDSDCFPIHDPRVLFETSPFTDTGLVLWPDFWYPSESFLFFEIAGISMPALNAQASTEAGEIMYSKSRHTDSLLLAAYYNYFGPDFYYPLQSQGAPGEGDKETFLWSAVALNASYHKVSTPVYALGYKAKDGQWRGSAMAQADPIQDLSDNNTARPFFLHVNFPKLDPGSIWDKESFGAVSPVRDSDGQMRRMWYDAEDVAVAYFDRDVERDVWAVVQDLACQYRKSIKIWRSKGNVCNKAKEYIQIVFSS